MSELFVKVPEDFVTAFRAYCALNSIRVGRVVYEKSGPNDLTIFPETEDSVASVAALEAFTTLNNLPGMVVRLRKASRQSPSYKLLCALEGLSESTISDTCQVLSMALFKTSGALPRSEDMRNWVLFGTKKTRANAKTKDALSKIRDGLKTYMAQKYQMPEDAWKGLVVLDVEHDARKSEENS